MGRGFLWRYGNAAFQRRFAGQAIRCLYAVWCIPMQGNFLPAKEPVQLAGVFTPCASLHHQVGRAFPRLTVDRQLPENGRILSQRNSTEFKTTACHSRMADARRILSRQYPGKILRSRYTTDAETIAGRPFKIYWLDNMNS